MDIDIDDDYDILGVRLGRNRTSRYRRHSVITSINMVHLRAIRSSADIVLEVIWVVKLLLIFIVVTIALSKRIHNERVTRECTKLMQIILPLLEICEHEVDELVGMEIDILAVRPEDRPPLPFHPRKNRRIDDLSLEFAT